ncbi:transposase [Escherichia coli]|nr:transposase [Escherichia coli]
MSKPKYPFEKRLEVVNHYFTTDDGYRIISARFGVVYCTHFVGR